MNPYVAEMVVWTFMVIAVLALSAGMGALFAEAATRYRRCLWRQELGVYRSECGGTWGCGTFKDPMIQYCPKCGRSIHRRNDCRERQ